MATVGTSTMLARTGMWTKAPSIRFGKEPNPIEGLSVQQARLGLDEVDRREQRLKAGTQLVAPADNRAADADRCVEISGMGRVQRVEVPGRRPAMSQVGAEPAADRFLHPTGALAALRSSRRDQQDQPRVATSRSNRACKSATLVRSCMPLVGRVIHHRVGGRRPRQSEDAQTARVQVDPPHAA
jgi:hypothetical protein